MAEFEKILAEGLKAGYAGETQRGKARRGPFEVKVSHHVTPDGAVHHDEWAANRTGGGQELAKTPDGRVVTRLYAGGVVYDEILTLHGLTPKDVTRYLKKKILEAGNKTRLFTDYNPPPDGEWQYRYVIVEQNEDIPLTVGEESIEHRDEAVFVHYFLLCPVE